MAGLAESRRGADVDPRRPTLSLKRDYLPLEACRFPLITIYIWLLPHLDNGSTN
jgi:hypothetical protein